jgi:hypothetical protein
MEKKRKWELHSFMDDHCCFGIFERKMEFEFAYKTYETQY